jgi:hypothetical protein
MATKKAKAKPAAAAATLTTEQLRELTGWTARHLRDLADQKWYPKPAHGKYQLIPTLKGIFGYLKDQAGKKGDAEKASRAAYWEVKRQREQWEFDQARGKFVEIGELQPSIRNTCLHLQAVIRRKLELELPARLRNKTEIEMREELKGAVDDLFKIFRDGVARWVATPAAEASAK